MKSANVFIGDNIIDFSKLRTYSTITECPINNFQDSRENKVEKLKSEVFINEEFEGYQYCRVVMEEILDLYGRLENKNFSHVIIKNDYDVYISHEKKILVSFAGKKVSDRLVKIFEDMLEIKFKQHIFDLEEITNDCSNVKKASFKDLTIQTVTSGFIKGNRLNETEIFLELIENGELGNITVTYPFGTKDVTLSVSHQGGIVLYSSLPKEEYLSLIKKIGKW